MASMARSDGPKGFSLESSLISRKPRSKAASGVFEWFEGLVTPMSRAGLETRSKKRLMLAASCHGRLGSRYWFVAYGSQTVDLLLGQRPEFPRRNIERERPVADALDLLHMVPHLFKHATDFSIAPLDQRNLIPRIRPFLNQPDSCRRGPHPASISSSDGDSPPQLLQRIIARSSSNLYHVR